MPTNITWPMTTESIVSIVGSDDHCLLSVISPLYVCSKTLVYRIDYKMSTLCEYRKRWYNGSSELQLAHGLPTHIYVGVGND